MKKYLIILSVSVSMSLFFASCGKEDPEKYQNDILPNIKSDLGEEIPNIKKDPVAKKCVDEGGKLIVKKSSTKERYVLCVFENGQICEINNLYKGDCKSGVNIVVE